MVRGNAARGQTGYADCASKVTGKGTLLLSDLWPADMRNEAGIGGADVSVILPGLLQAQSTIDGTPDVPGILVFLAVVLPPAHRAQSHCARSVQCSASAAGAPKTSLSEALYVKLDGTAEPEVYPKSSFG